MWPDSCARVSLSKSSSKQRIRQRWGPAGGRRPGTGVQPCWARPRSALGAVVLFTVRLVPQDAVHLVRDGRRQLRKDLQGARESRGLCRRAAVTRCGLQRALEEDFFFPHRSVISSIDKE